jgi:hypothetical protein
MHSTCSTYLASVEYRRSFVSLQEPSNQMTFDTFPVMPEFYDESCSSNPHREGSPLVGNPGLFIKYISSSVCGGPGQHQHPHQGTAVPLWQGFHLTCCLLTRLLTAKKARKEVIGTSVVQDVNIFELQFLNSRLLCIAAKAVCLCTRPLCLITSMTLPNPEETLEHGGSIGDAFDLSSASVRSVSQGVSWGGWGLFVLHQSLQRGFGIFFFLLLPLRSIGLISQFLDHSRTVGLLGRVISPSQGLYLNTGQHKHRKTHTHIKYPCPEWDSNPRSRLPSERRQYMQILE